MRPLFAAPALLALAACAGEPPAEPADPGRVMVETGEFLVPSGDVLECFYTDLVTDRAMAVVGTFGVQSTSGHHVAIYYSTEVRAPEHHPCDDAEMTRWRMIGAAGEAGDAEGDLRLTDGLAVHIPAGVQIVLQAHYINTGEPFMANDTAGVDLIDDDEVTDYVGQFVTLDTGFRVPSHQEASSTSVCTVPEDVQIVRLLGHMHEWGQRYTLEQVDERDETIRVLVDEEWRASYTSHPPVHMFGVDDPLVLPAGTRLRQTCSWRNDETYDLVFPREMCIGYGLYFPDSGETFCQEI